MMKEKSIESGPHFLTHSFFFRLFAVLLLLTLLSFRMVCGLMARYSSSDWAAGGARVAAAAGGVSIYEYRADYDEDNFRYVLDKDTVVDGNTYSVVVPGMKIAKDAFIRMEGQGDASYTLYLELAPSAQDVFLYELDSSQWVADENLTPRFGGRVYRYAQAIAPHTRCTIPVHFQDGCVYISDSLRDKSRPDYNAQSAGLQLYAYLIQAD